MCTCPVFCRLYRFLLVGISGLLSSVLPLFHQNHKFLLAIKSGASWKILLRFGWFYSFYLFRLCVPSVFWITLSKALTIALRARSSFPRIKLAESTVSSKRCIFFFVACLIRTAVFIFTLNEIIVYVCVALSSAPFFVCLFTNWPIMPRIQVD